MTGSRRFLPKKELDAVILAWRAAAPGRTRERLFSVIHQNVANFIHKMARRVSRPDPSTLDDVTQAGWMTVLRSLGRYDPHHGAKFLSFVGRSVFLDMLRVFKARRVVSGQQCVYWDGPARVGEDTAMRDTMKEGTCSDETAIAAWQSHSQASALLAGLPGGPNKSVVEDVMAGHEFRDIAARLGVSTQRAHQRWVQAAAAMREAP